MRWIGLLAVFASAALFADFSDTLAPAMNHPAIRYFGPARDPIAKLNQRLIAGTARLTWAERGGFLQSVLDALAIPVESQMMVFSKTSLQLDLIEPRNPRSVFFNDSVSVAWMYGGFIEVAAQDPVQGIVFYKLHQTRGGVPAFERTDTCLRCHQAEPTLNIPGMLVRSVSPAASGVAMLIYGGTFPDHRTPFEDRWGGWYVTGAPAGMRHMGNAVITNRDQPELVNSAPLSDLRTKFPVDRYLSPYSDAAALLVFDHQMHLMNLITRMNWETRAGTQEKRRDLDRVIEEGARELVDYLLFVDEVPLKGRASGTSGFAAKFAAQGPMDSKGRRLRKLNLETRVFEYPCSYMIYSEAFNALPGQAKAAIYRRMWRVLSGGEKDVRYARLAGAGRRAVIEILRETKPEVLEYFR
ncbi:MAG: hypothetical protein ABI811_23855 [Acidobacteriota bacterium]